jgi:hypothetical protein
MTVDEQIENLRTELKESYIKSGLITKKTKIKLFYGDLKDICNNVLIVAPPPPSKFFNSPEDERLIRVLSEFNILNYFITYYYLIPDKKVSRKEVKDFSYWIKKITDILEPRIIVCVGEESQFCYLKQKKVMRDFHGKQIGDYNSIPIYTLHPTIVYMRKYEHEDSTYKDFMKNHDWGAIQKKYIEVIDVKSS